MRIAATEKRFVVRVDEKLTAFLELESAIRQSPKHQYHRNQYPITRLPVTVIEIKPFRNGWKCFEAPGVQPVFLNQEQAIDYAKGRACFRSGEIRVLSSSGNVERVIPFDDSTRKP